MQQKRFLRIPEPLISRSEVTIEHLRGNSKIPSTANKKKHKKARPVKADRAKNSRDL
jgi:hypothetical protein